MNTLAANASTSVSLPAGSFLAVSGGYGTMQIVSPNVGPLMPVSPRGVKIGPLDIAVTVNLVSTANAWSYYTESSTAPNVKAATDPLTGGITLSAGSVSIPLDKPVWRGISQGMSLAVQGFGGGTNVWSMTHRTRHYSNVRFKRVRAILQTFYMTGTPIADTNFANDYNFQVGLEQGYTGALTGLAPRKMFTFGGSETAQYLTASPPSTGYIMSDVMELDTYIGAQELFGLWTTVEAAARTGSNLIPYTRSSSNYLQKYIGSVSAASTSQIDANTAKTATSVTAATSTQSGGSNYFTPCMLLVETDSGLPFVFVIGDSISYGVGESVAGSGSVGDGVGSALSNLGYAERAINETLGFNCVNISKGADGDKYLFTAANWAKRSQLMVLANPTHILRANVHNDITPTITINGWSNNTGSGTTYAKWNVVSSNSNLYICVQGGLGSTTTGPSGTGGGIPNGACLWAYLGPLPGTATPRGSALVISHMAAVNHQIKEALPSVKIVGMVATPDASSSDSWATTANQTAATNWGDATSRRALVNGYIKAKTPILQLSAYFDPNTAIEDSPDVQTSKWAVNGSASYLTNDGTHPNSVGHALMAATLTADKFA